MRATRWKAGVWDETREQPGLLVLISLYFFIFRNIVFLSFGQLLGMDKAAVQWWSMGSAGGPQPSSARETRAILGGPVRICRAVLHRARRPEMHAHIHTYFRQGFTDR